jgi:hypothetical protein
MKCLAIKDPVMHLDEDLTQDTVYDKSVYREFGKSGDKVTFVVWPALFLHEGAHCTKNCRMHLFINK